jgi:polysaccharide biosynthesis/export protein
MPTIQFIRSVLLKVIEDRTKYVAYAGIVFAMLFATIPASAQDNNYRLATGDSIRIVVFQNPDMTLETRVSEDGTITYPLVGVISIGQLDIGVAEKKIAKALKDGGFLKDPQVNIQLLEIRGNKVAVLGQVNKAGAFPLQTMSTRVSQMLAEAGGQTTLGADRVIVSGTRDGKPFRREIDIDSLYRSQRPDDDVVLAGGDTIYVPRAPVFYIYGEVVKPGDYKVDRNMTMRQAIAAGGGLTLRGTERRLRVVRANAQGAKEKVSVDLDDPVQPGDVITVAESIF